MRDYFKFEKTQNVDEKTSTIEVGFGWAGLFLGCVYGAGVITGAILFRK